MSGFRYPYFDAASLGIARQPPPRRLTLEDLLSLQYEAPQAPDPITSVRDLEGDDRRRAQLDSLWAGLAAVGAGINTGDWNRATANGMASIQDAQMGALAMANQRQQLEYQRQLAQQQAAQQRDQEKAKAAGLLGMYNKIAEAEPEGSALISRAEAAARAGSMSELEQLAGQIPQRAAARGKGYDPDAWGTNERLQQELAIELENAKRGATRDSRMADEKAKLEMEHSYDDPTVQNFADGSTRQWDGEKWVVLARKPVEPRAPLIPTTRNFSDGTTRQWNPATGQWEVITQQAGGAGGVAGGRLFKQGEQIVYAVPPNAEHPNGFIRPLDGQPAQVGNLTYFSVDGIRYVQNKDRPELGAREVPLHQEGDEDAPPMSEFLRPQSRGGGPAAGGAARPPAQRVKDIESVLKRPLTQQEREGALRDMNQGVMPRDIVSRLKKPSPGAAIGRQMGGPGAGPPPKPAAPARPSDIPAWGSPGRIGPNGKPQPVNAYESLPPAEQTAISREAEKRWKRLTPEERQQWGGFTMYVGEAYKRRATQLGTWRE